MQQTRQVPINNLKDLVMAVPQTLPFIIAISVIRGWTLAIEAREGTDDMREQNPNPWLPLPAFIAFNLLLQIIGIFTKGSLTFYNMLEVADRLPQEATLEEISEDNIQDNTSAHSKSASIESPQSPLPDLGEPGEVPSPSSTTDSIIIPIPSETASPALEAAAPLSYPRLRKAAFFGLTFMTSSILAPFVYDSAHSQMVKRFPSASPAVHMGIGMFSSAAALTGYLYVESRALYKDLCDPEEIAHKQRLARSVKLLIAMLQLFIFTTHTFGSIFQGGEAYHLPTTEDGCPLVNPNDLGKLLLAAHVIVASSSYGATQAAFEGSQILAFEGNTLKFWLRDTLKEQVIAFCAVIFTAVGALAHAMPSVTQANTLSTCYIPSTLTAYTLTALLAVCEVVLDILVEGKAVEESLKMVLNPRSISKLTFQWQWGKSARQVDVEQNRPLLEDGDDRYAETASQLRAR